VTPVERAEAELTRLDLCLPSRDRRPAARAVFESIDLDELARVLQQATDDGADRTEDYARAVVAHLTKGNENDE